MYARLSDWQILNSLCAPRDKKTHQLVTLRQRFTQQRGGNAPGRPSLRWGKFPTQAELQIPDEALALHPGATGEFVFMYWQTWRDRGLTPEQIMARWKTFKG